MGKATMSHACSRDPDQPMHLYSQKVQSQPKVMFFLIVHTQMLAVLSGHSYTLYLLISLLFITLFEYFDEEWTKVSIVCFRSVIEPKHELSYLWTLYSQQRLNKFAVSELSTESLLDTQWIDKDPIFCHSDSKGMQIWVLAVHTLECFFPICRFSHGL